MNSKLFVGNLSADTSLENLQAAFAAHGIVTHANLILDHLTRLPRGFAFVTMDTVKEAQSAMAALNGKELNGNVLTVSLARRREERPHDKGAGRIYKEDDGRNRDHNRH